LINIVLQKLEQIRPTKYNPNQKNVKIKSK